MQDLDGRSYKGDWELLEYMKYAEHKYMSLSDNLHYIPGECIISKKAKEVLCPYIGERVEFLPVLVENKEYYLVNPIGTIECLNYNRSEYIFWGESYYYLYDKKILFLNI